MMRLRRFHLIALALILAAHPAQAPAQADARTQPADAPNKVDDPAPLTVAILPFDAKSAKNEDLGKQITAVMQALLAGNSEFRLVDRGQLERTLEEQALSLTGMVSNDEAVKVGKLVGARLIVTGRSFQLGQKVFVTAKLIGTETSLMEAMVVRGAPQELDRLVADLAMKLAKRLRDRGPALVAQDDAKDPLPELKQTLKGQALPKVAIVVLEEHRRTRPVEVPDPAAETQIKQMLLDCGFEVVDVNANDLTDWIDDGAHQRGAPWPRALAEADVLITGKGFSERAGQIGNLISAAARVEINMIRRNDGRVVLARAANTRGVDLAENVAAKRALQKAGEELALAVLRYYADMEGDAVVQQEAGEPE